MKTFTASDRTSLIRLASSLPKGSDERRAILGGLKTASDKWLDGLRDIREAEKSLHRMAGRPSWATASNPAGQKKIVQKLKKAGVDVRETYVFEFSFRVFFMQDDKKWIVDWEQDEFNPRKSFVMLAEV